MWLWFVLGALLIGIAWALKFTLLWPMWIPLVATGAVVVLVALIGILKWYLALRAAKKLQEVIENQGVQQAMNARPERRAEIAELRKKLLGGLSALKTSKLGRGGKRGGAALYTMPWYMIIGPPGAGKTTALTHSGLVFPYGSSSSPGASGGGGGGIRGVGGTRNCDWWFTNEAILLDTAGRYTTESDDREEWISFLNFLKKYRPKRPINGIIIAISISELIDANEMQIEAIGKKLRSRIDEVAAQLHMVLPVYLLFTKVDLIAGFTEFFGDMRKSDRSKCFGATIKLDLPKNEPGAIFAGEFDILVKHLHSRGLKRLVMERSREGRERMYQFPLEFAGLKKNLTELIGIAFQPNTIQGTPIFRGFYFTSGTQEGRPMDRVLERMSAAMGIRTQAQLQQQQQQQAPVVESKSYFLHDVFMTVIFPDGDIAVRSAVEERRQALMKVAIAGATFALAAILAIPGLTSYTNNKTFIRESNDYAKEASSVHWDDEKLDPADKIKKLNTTLEQLKRHDNFDTKGVPITMGWGLFQADKVRRPLLSVYAAQMQAGFALAVKKRLEERLRTITGKQEEFLQDWLAFRQYLMLGKIDGKLEHLDVEWATGRFTALWAHILKEGSSRLEEWELKNAIRPHVEYYFQMIKRGKVTPVELDQETIIKARSALQAVQADWRYYELLVNWLTDERIDESGDTAYANLVFPPFELPKAFPNRTQEILDNAYNSNVHMEAVRAKGKSATEWKRVDGPYTYKGYIAVLHQLENAEGLLKTESWVVPLTKDETPEAIAKQAATVKLRYEDLYIKEWLDLFQDIRAKIPDSGAQAATVYREISAYPNPSPLSNMVQAIAENTQLQEIDPLATEDCQCARFNERMTRYRRAVEPSADLKKTGEKGEKISKTFEATVRFGRGIPPGVGDIPGFKYTNDIVLNLKNKIITELGKRGGQFALTEIKSDIDAAHAAAEALIKQCDDTCQKMLTALLLDPLTIGERPTLGGVNPGTIGPAPPTTGPPIQTQIKKIPPYPFRTPPGGRPP